VSSANSYPFGGSLGSPAVPIPTAKSKIKVRRLNPQGTGIAPRREDAGAYGGNDEAVSATRPATRSRSDDTKALVKKLKADGALPDFYVLENYRPLPVALGYVNTVGPESNPNSIAAVATWVAGNAPVAVQPGGKPR
jgi:hypothetical protein